MNNLDEMNEMNNLDDRCKKWMCTYCLTFCPNCSSYNPLADNECDLKVCSGLSKPPCVLTIDNHDDDEMMDPYICPFGEKRAHWTLIKPEEVPPDIVADVPESSIRQRVMSDPPKED